MQSIFRQAFNIEKLQADRRLLAGVLRIVEPMQGKYVKQQGDAFIAELREAIAACEAVEVKIIPQWIQAYTPSGSPVFDCKGLKQELERIENRIHCADTLHTLPELDEYAAAYQAFCSASAALENAAKAVGIQYGTLGQAVKMPTFSA